MRLSSFGGYGLALAALARVVFGAYDSYPNFMFRIYRVESNKECLISRSHGINSRLVRSNLLEMQANRLSLQFNENASNKRDVGGKESRTNLTKSH